MNTKDILHALGLLAATGAALSACAKPTSSATEVPAASSPASASGESCLHAEGCCGGHEPGDGSCGEDRAAGADPSTAATDTSTADAKWARTWTIAPGDMAEINLELDDGDTMAAIFSTDGAPLKWNVHSHEGREAIIYAQGEDASGELRHDVAKGGMYSFLWLNEGPAPVRLTVELGRGAGQVHSTHPAD